MAQVPTVKIVNPQFAGGFLIINAADFDPAVHERYEEAAAPVPAAPAVPAAAPETPTATDDPAADATVDPQTVLGGKVPDIKTFIRQTADPAVLVALLDTESQTLARKSVIEAIDARLAELR